MAKGPFEIQSGFIKSMLVNAAVKLNVAGIIAATGQDATLSAREIATKLPTSRPNVSSLERLLRLLSLHNVLRAVEQQDGGESEARYGLTAVSQQLVPVLDDRVEPFTAAHDGKNVWDLTTEDATLGKVFNHAMATGFSNQVWDMMLPTYQGFKDAQVIADVGGGIGKFLTMILQYNPHLKGINFDQPHVVATAPEIPGVTHVGGNMFEKVREADIIYMKWILHDWSDEQTISILRNCWKSLPDKGGKVVLVERVLTLPNHNNQDQLRSTAERDLAMLTITSGKERTAVEWKSVLSAAGFSQVRFLPFKLLPDHNIIEALK